MIRQSQLNTSVAFVFRWQHNSNAISSRSQFPRLRTSANSGGANGPQAVSTAAHTPDLLLALPESTRLAHQLLPHDATASRRPTAPTTTTTNGNAMMDDPY